MRKTNKYVMNYENAYKFKNFSSFFHAHFPIINFFFISHLELFFWLINCLSSIIISFFFLAFPSNAALLRLMKYDHDDNEKYGAKCFLWFFCCSLKGNPERFTFFEN
jgi:hypothetical protein